MKNNEIWKILTKIEKSIKTSPEESSYLINKIAENINSIKNNTEKADIYFQMGRIYSALRNYKKSITYFKNALNIFERLGEKKKIITCYYFIAYRASFLNLFEEAIKYFTLSLNASSNNFDIEIHSDSALKLGIIYNKIGVDNKALEMLFLAIKVLPEDKKQSRKALAMTNIGICFNNLGLHDKAIEYHLKGIERCIKLNDLITLAAIYSNIAVSYELSKKFETALEYNFKALELREKENNAIGINTSFNNIGSIYRKQKKYKSALDFFLKAEKIVPQNDIYLLASTFLNLGDIYAKLSENKKALGYYQKAINNAEIINIKSLKMDIYKSAKDFYFELEMFKTSFLYQKKYYELKESLINIETAKKIEENHLNQSNDFYLSAKPVTEFQGMIGQSKEMREVFSLIETIAEHNVNVLITGATGSGKELIARAIHNKYKKKSPFVAINCAAIPEQLLESELFGHTKGAFTGAVKDKIGKIQSADKGTLFLDEIGDMPLSLQSKILRMIQERTITPVGSTKIIPVEIRIISATHRNLNQMILKKEFRDDLYYRLNVIRIKSPALKDRKIDIPLLVNHFIKKYNLKYNKNVSGVTADVMKYLQSLSWAGNIRQLENEIEKAVLLCKIDLIHLDLFTDNSEEEAGNISSNLPGKWAEYKKYKAELNHKLDLAYIHELLSKTGQSILDASNIGKIPKSQIYRILNKETFLE